MLHLVRDHEVEKVGKKYKIVKLQQNPDTEYLIFSL